MDPGNHSLVTEFILAGLTEQPQLQLLFFFLFLGIYVVTVVGNLGMITLIGLSSHLHTPMYYFLINLSFIDFCHSTVITPKMLVSFVTEKNIISYTECMTQLYFFIIFIIAEGYMLAVMAFDRYVAICNPLLYNVIMSYQNINSHCEAEADVIRHGDVVKQGVADGNIAVICHHSQHVTF